MKNEIISLKMPERVRLRPNVIFGYDDARGSLESVKMLLGVFLTEALMGFCKKIDMRILKDSSIEIISHDRGIVLDEALTDGKPAWHYVFCELYAGPRESEEYRPYLRRRHDEIYGSADEAPLKYGNDEDAPFALCCVQCVSEFMTVESAHGGIKKRLFFEKGRSVGEAEASVTKEPSYTKICFRPDGEVFSDIRISAEAISYVLRIAAVTVPGLVCSLEDERTGLRNVYCFEGGIGDYVRDAAGDSARTPFYVREIEATGKDRYNRKEYNARVRVVLTFTQGNGFTECFHNCRALEGGEHLEAAREKILQKLQWHFCEEGLKDISWDRIKNKVLLVIETSCSENSTRWLNGRREYITNAMIKDITSDLFEEDFNYFVRRNRDLISSVLKT